MAEIMEVLQALGFGEYEARAYVALLKHSPLNGYELAKDSGLPRANVYSVLGRLEERGAVVRLDTPSGTRYSAIPPSELMGSRAISSSRSTPETIAATSTRAATTKWMRMFRCVRRTWMIPSNA